MQLKSQNSGSKTICGFSITLILKELWRFKVKKSMLYVKQKINFNKTRWNRKWKISHILLKRRTLCISSCKNHILKAKLWVGARKRKKSAFALSGGNFFNICFVLMYSETFRIFLLLHIKKHYFIHFLLVFKIVESLQSIHKLVKQTQKISEIIQVILTFVFYQLLIWICSSYEWKTINRTLYKI